jgi:mannosyl-oligosaccharide alpha-1,2-mannosidase
MLTTTFCPELFFLLISILISIFFKLSYEHNRYAHTKTGLSPESVHTHKKMKSSHAAYYMLRPETVESFYILSTLTGDPIYREWGWEIFQSIEKYCKTEIAYGHYHNVNDATIDPEDNLESFFLAETLKYLYLLFDTDSEIDILGKVRYSNL